MEDKAEFVYRQYDLDVMRTYKIKGCVCLDTKQGEYVIRPYGESAGRAAFENSLKSYLMDSGFKNVDIIFPNSSGELISFDQYRNPVVVKKLIKGRECSLTDRKELKAASKALAGLHIKLEEGADSFIAPKGEEGSYVTDKTGSSGRYQAAVKDIRKMLGKHCLELARVRKYILSGRRNNEFESEFIRCFDIYYRQAQEAPELLEGDWYEGYMDMIRRKKTVCHQSFDQHSILFTGEGTKDYGIINFEHCGVSSLMTDLYQILRKALEKNEWDTELGRDIIDSYDSERDISEDEMRILKAMLRFPEKFWKLADRYINRKKSLITQRSMIKLKALNDQEENRKKFIKFLEEAY